MQSTVLTLIILTLILLILQIAKRFIPLSNYCIMCGQSMRAQDITVDIPEKYCSNCNLIFMKKGQLDSREREIKLLEITQRNRFRWFMGFLFGIVFPGAGEIYMGRIWRGSILILIWTLFVSYWISSDYRFISYWSCPSVRWILGTVFMIITMVIVYFLSISGVIKGQKD